MLRLRQSHRAEYQTAGNRDHAGRCLWRRAGVGVAPATRQTAGRRQRVNARIIKPASRNGVGPSSIALPPGPWPTVMAFLLEQFPAIPPAIWLSRMQEGAVLDAQGRTLSATSAYLPN